MNLKNPKALVLSGDGTTGEIEAARALQMAQFDSDIRHIHDLIQVGLNTDALSKEYSALVIPGGFSYGDHLGAGKIYALQILHSLKWDLHQYVNRGGLVLGISHGFQTLIRMGIFGKEISMTSNLTGKYLDDWTRVIPRGNRCVWLRGVGNLDLPIRHSQGRFIFSTARKAETLDKMTRQGMRCLMYEENLNGSEESIAGLCDPTGRIFGMMPHPESALSFTQHPDWIQQRSRANSPGQGLVLFENAYHEALASR